MGKAKVIYNFDNDEDAKKFFSLVHRVVTHSKFKSAFTVHTEITDD